jgi:hypothetical protein
MRSTLFKNWALFSLIALSFSNECISGNKGSTLWSDVFSSEKTESPKGSENEFKVSSAIEAETIFLNLMLEKTAFSFWKVGANNDNEGLRLPSDINRFIASLLAVESLETFTQTTDKGIKFTLVLSAKFPGNDPRNERGSGWQAPNETVWYTTHEPLAHASAIAKCNEMKLTMPSLEDFAELDKNFTVLPLFLSDQNTPLWTSSMNDKGEMGIHMLQSPHLGGFSFGEQRQLLNDDSIFINPDALYHFCCILKPDQPKDANQTEDDHRSLIIKTRPPIERLPSSHFYFGYQF